MITMKRRGREFKCVFMMEEIVAIRDIKYCHFLHKIFFINFLYAHKPLTTNVLLICTRNLPIVSMRFKVHLPMPQFATATRKARRKANRLFFEANKFMWAAKKMIIILICFVYMSRLFLSCIVSMCALVKSMIPIKLDMLWTKKHVVK